MILSPVLGETRVRWRRDRITARPREGFRANTVYRVELLPVITDLRQNRLRTGRTVVFTTGAERVVKLGRGTLAVGAPGDVTVFDLDREWTFNVNDSLSKSKNSPFDGRKFHGGPVATIVAGKLVWNSGRGLLAG